jgi:hypothetical protein
LGTLERRHNNKYSCSYEPSKLDRSKNSKWQKRVPTLEFFEQVRNIAESINHSHRGTEQEIQYSF